MLQEGIHVRLTGQDVERGTFSHRHAVFRDQKTGAKYTPLNNLAKSISRTPIKSDTISMETQSEFTIRNSILSEFGVLGFEMGYAGHNPNSLVLWEAQFGDFVNGAQIIIDQFLTSGEDKWLRQNGLVMLLPHGMAGQGAEHSSCRIERFLQQVDEDPDSVPPMESQIQHTNIQVVNPTTPANYYHVLRRQVHREFRKPLIIATPKNLLRDKRCTSTLEEMAEGTRFQRAFSEQDNRVVEQADKVRRLIICSGKVYFDLVDARNKRGITDIAIMRLEQLAPFPFDFVSQEAKLFPNAEIVYCQEEHKNMGAWSFVEPRVATATRVLNGSERRARYVGRCVSAATATGLGQKVHDAEEAEFLAAAFA